ncbi:MAG: hypothetical protein ACJKTH_00860 [Patescibacteria group bacterium UBA2163]
MNKRESLRVTGKVLHNSTELVCGSAAMALALMLFMDWTDLSSDPISNTVIGASGAYVSWRAAYSLNKIPEDLGPKTDDSE